MYVPIHWPNFDLGRVSSTASSWNRFSMWDQPSWPTFLVMNFKPRSARAAPDLERSTDMGGGFLKEVMRFSSWETCLSRNDSWEPSEADLFLWSWLARYAVSESPPLMSCTETESSRTSRVISTYSSSSLNRALLLLLFRLLLFLLLTRGPLSGPLYPTDDLLPLLSVSDHVSFWFSWISIATDSLLGFLFFFSFLFFSNWEKQWNSLREWENGEHNSHTHIYVQYDRIIL